MLLNVNCSEIQSGFKQLLSTSLAQRELDGEEEVIDMLRQVEKSLLKRFFLFPRNF